MDADAKRPGGGGQKLTKSCGRLLWMAPYWALGKEHMRKNGSFIVIILLTK